MLYDVLAKIGVSLRGFMTARKCNKQVTLKYLNFYAFDRLNLKGNFVVSKVSTRLQRMDEYNEAVQPKGSRNPNKPLMTHTSHGLYPVVAWSEVCCYYY